MSFNLQEALAEKYSTRFTDLHKPGAKDDSAKVDPTLILDSMPRALMARHPCQSGDPLGDAAHNQCSLVTGHQHGNFDISYAASSARLYWSMRSGCLIDKDALAFAYGKHTRYKPVIGCSAIVDGQPLLIPMVLSEDGRWIGELV